MSRRGVDRRNVRRTGLSVPAMSDWDDRGVVRGGKRLTLVACSRRDDGGDLDQRENRDADVDLSAVEHGHSRHLQSMNADQFSNGRTLPRVGI